MTKSELNMFGIQPEHTARSPRDLYDKLTDGSDGQYLGSECSGCTSICSKSDVLPYLTFSSIPNLRSDVRQTVRVRDPIPK